MGLELRLRAGRPDPREVVVDVVGEIDVQSAPLLKEGVDRAVAAGARTVALDLSRVTFIDSSGLGAVLGRHRLLDRVGGRLRLVAPTEQTRRLLAVTGLDQVLDVQAEPS